MVSAHAGSLILIRKIRTDSARTSIVGGSTNISYVVIDYTDTFDSKVTHGTSSIPSLNKIRSHFQMFSSISPENFNAFSLSRIPSQRLTNGTNLRSVYIYVRIRAKTYPNEGEVETGSLWETCSVNALQAPGQCDCETLINNPINSSWSSILPIA